ncbi:MAG: hypothetical protein IJB27_07475 [Clostridia bacterium]|nr:hypothetical protein [Clostridia bacterium]
MIRISIPPAGGDCTKAIRIKPVFLLCVTVIAVLPLLTFVVLGIRFGNTAGGDLDVVQFQKGTNWGACRAVFSYDTADYTIHFYNPWYSASYWVEIVK